MIPDDIKSHIQALEQWLDQLCRIPKQPSGLSAEERKQLQAVNRAVGQLQRNGITVPEELRNLKLQLSAKDNAGLEDHEMETRLKKVESLIQALGKTIKTARVIRDKMKSTGQAGGPKKYYGVRLADLIRAGLLSVDDRLELQWLKNGPAHKGKVQSDGTVLVKTSDGWQRYESLSTAASRVAGRSLNGWKHWHFIKHDGTTTALEDIRAKYLKEEEDG
jgi:hypothetical protein